MRLLIVLDTITAGVSGVADYALLLGQAIQSNSNVDVTFHPLGHKQSRERELLQRVQELKPDWVSFHFVPYAYATRGFVTGLTLPWSQLRGLIGTHIYFHELWIGAHQGASLRHRLSGLIQRRGIHQLMQNLQPTVVHTSNHLYSAMLHNDGIQSRVLPLFSTIPTIRNVSDPYLETLQSFSPGTSRDEWVVAIFFGAIYPCINLLPALQWLHKRCDQQRKRLLVVSLGHSPTAKKVFSHMSSQFPEENPPLFLVKGRMESKLLSLWLTNADCGLATTPYNIIAKSASAISLSEHGLPVLVVDPGAPVRCLPYHQPDLAPEFWLFGDRRLEGFPCLPPRRKQSPLITRVVHQFLDDLSLHSS